MPLLILLLCFVQTIAVVPEFLNRIERLRMINLCLMNHKCTAKHLVEFNTIEEYIEEVYNQEISLPQTFGIRLERLLQLIPPRSDHPDHGPHLRKSLLWCYLAKDSVPTAQTYKDCQ